jgi:hypothetical protein
MEKLDATQRNSMFGDDNISFDLQLKTFGVDMGALKELAIEHVYWAVEDWEEEAQNKNDCVAKVQLLAKYKGLVFCDPNKAESFWTWEQNMEFCQERGNGWFLVGVCADDEDNNEAFTLEVACELIGETPQWDGVQVIHQNKEE